MEQKTEQQMREDPRSWNDSRERKPVAQATVATVAKVTSFAERLREVRPSKKIVFGLMAAAAVLTMIVGFRWGGWVTGSAAHSAAATAANAAVVSRLAPICVAQFNLDPQKDQKLSELKAMTSSYQRTTYLATQTWAIMPGETKSDSGVADACARLLFGS